MAAPLRKPRKSAASQPSGEKRRFVVRLSGPMATLLGAILAVAVCWSFFMGFMVGRGQNPETRVEQMTNLISPDAPSGAQAQQDAPAPDAAAQPETADQRNQAPGADENQASGATAPQQGSPEQEQKGQKAAQTQQGQQTTQGRAYPFSQPTGSGLAAWGIKPGAAQEQGAQNAAQSATQAAKPAPVKTGPQFDYVYQVAAFKSADDADNLRTRLEGKGLRTRTRKSGKLVLVMVNMRGTEDDALALRDDLRRMKLGVPMQISKKPVSKKPQKSKR